MVNAGDVVLYSMAGAVAAYVTNFMGFRDWVASQSGAFGEVGGGAVEQYEEKGGSGKTVKEEEQDIISKLLNPKPYVPPKTGTTFNCVTYPRCNTVSGTDARKKCCCTNKCSLLGRTFKSMNYSTGECFCNPKATTVTPLTNPACICGGGITGCGNLGSFATSATCRSCCCTKICAAKYPGRKPRVSGSSCYCDPVTVPMVGGCTKTRFQECASTCAQKYPGRKPVLSADCKTCYCRTATSALARSYQTIPPFEDIDEGLMQVPTIA